ncbi:QueT transporter family protein [Pseudoflavonifractor sp. 60]|uniref:QueT transporter family protein n=1 Tax=Pseudoflavonifractor sp. 60 TaxID=2304576 RepID=UPI00136A02AF|nr:QueT transporter family protein [Pseudoflavonifractor sp. 60]NBI65616.1 QueT transporter family protein [Pseudoflavonifractor sp. 60]
MHRFTIRDLTLAALLAAVYAVLTVALPIPQYSGVQLRVAEAMTVLPFLFPAATPGLFVGCIIANLFSPYPLDILCGSLATLLACLLTQRMPNRWLAALPPVVCNAVIVGAEIAWFETGFGPGFLPAYAFNAFTVGLGELIACFLLGELLLAVLPKAPVLRPYMQQSRLVHM